MSVYVQLHANYKFHSVFLKSSQDILDWGDRDFTFYSLPWFLCIMVYDLSRTETNHMNFLSHYANTLDILTFVDVKLLDSLILLQCNAFETQ